VKKLTKDEYKEKVWEILKGYLDMDIEDIEELLEKIMAIQTPDEKGKKTDNRQKKLF